MSEERTCKTCKFANCEWFQLPCDSCTGACNEWEPRDDKDEPDDKDHEGCEGCIYESRELYDWPCVDCKFNADTDNDFWTDKSKTDVIDRPAHYQLPGLPCESIEVIKAVLGVDGFKKFCRGNALKYLIRADHKGGTEDLKKAMKYLEWEIEGLDTDAIE